jgi:hypothetical protein
MESFGNENKKRRTCEIDTDSRIDRLTEMLHQQQELLNVKMGFQSKKSTTSNLSVNSKPKFSQIISKGSQNLNQNVSINNPRVEETMPSTGKNIKINKTSPIPSVDEFSNLYRLWISISAVHLSALHLSIQTPPLRCLHLATYWFCFY